MSLTQREKQIIEYGIQQGKTKEQSLAALGEYRASTPTSTQQDTGSMSDNFIGLNTQSSDGVAESFEDIKQTGRGIFSQFRQAGEDIVDIAKDEDLSLGEKARGIGARAFSGGARAVVEEPFKGLVKLNLSQEQEDKLKSSVESFGETLAETQAAESLVNWYQSKPEDTQREINNALGYGEGLAELVGLGTGIKLTKQGFSKVNGFLGKIDDLVKRADEPIDEAVKQVEAPNFEPNDFTDPVLKERAAAGTLTKGILDTVRNIPSRISTNLRGKLDTERAIQQLPTRQAQKSVREGVDITDVNKVVNVSDSQKPIMRKLYDSVLKYVDDPQNAQNPIEVVGQEMVKPIKELDKIRRNIGQQLGEVAENLGGVTKPELTTSVLSNMQKVSGLQGIKLTNKGLLDFSDTSIASSITKADQNAIQEAFKQATELTDGVKAHRFRQELFEVLGGKKKSLSNMTDTQERAYQAIRKGLSDVLEGKNSQYKKLSNDYRQAISPLQEIRKFLKAEGLDEDLLDLKAGTLARRLTSTASTNADIQQALRNIDEVVGSNSEVSARQLQEFYNVLETYYPEITQKTSLRGSVQGSPDLRKGIIERVSESIGGVVGQTDDSVRKAIDDLIRDTLGVN